MANPSTLALLALSALSCGGSAWHTDLEQAFARAADTGKPLLVVFR